MPCYALYDKGRNRIGTICGKLGKHCAECAGAGGFLCDYPVGKGKTCDRSLCDFHAHEVATDMHYCTQHYNAWCHFRNDGGIEHGLGHVEPSQLHMQFNRDD